MTRYYSVRIIRKQRPFIVVAHLGSTGFPLLARNVLDLDYLGAHESSLLPMPHEVHLAKRPHPQYL